jgi:MarR family transcriptional regulator, organic hydroperoxide resistance regulator
MAGTSAATGERTEAVEAVLHAFKRATAAVRRLRGRDTHRPGELSHAQYQVLFALSRTANLSAGELAARADLSPASVTQMLDRLADAGLVERVRSKDDRRIVVSRLTRVGDEVCEKRRAELEPMWRETLAEFNASELHTAAEVIDRLGQLFERLGEHDEPGR